VVAAPGEGQVRVGVEAIGLNLADVFAVLGLYGATPKGEFVPGLEYSGVVCILIAFSLLILMIAVVTYLSLLPQD